MSGIITNTMQEISGFDSGTKGTATTAINVARGDFQKVTVFVKEAGGDMNGLILMPQFSPNGTDWYDSDHAIAAVSKRTNFSFQVPTCGASFMCICVATQSAIASTIDLCIEGV
jgi:hypothetical protein